MSEAEKEGVEFTPPIQNPVVEPNGAGDVSEDGTKATSQSVLQKEKPETLLLRAQPVRVLRFKREIILAGAAVASVGLAATTWWALTPAGPSGQASSGKDTDAARSPSDAVEGLPESYDAVPKLGPRLPGDLGRPILKRQQELDTVVGTDDNIAARDAAAARQRAEAELRAARQSALIASIATRETAAVGIGREPVKADGDAVSAAAADASLDADRDPNGQGHKAQFMAARDSVSDLNPYGLEPPFSPNILSAGSVIPASLITGLRSDLPGLVTAQVSERVCDSATGRILLIPQGARLIGKYDSVVAFGQSRALVAWQRIIMPNGSSIRLDNAPATDPSGYAGLADKVDFHTWRLLQGVAISTLLGVSANLTFTGESDLVQAIREATQQNVARAGDQITQRNLQVQPTITIRPGSPVRLLVHRDLILPPWKE